MANMCIVNSIRIMPWKVHNARFCNAYMSSPAIPQRQSDWYLLMGGIHAVWLPARYPRLEQISPAIDWFLLCSMILFMLLVNSTNFHFTKSRLCLSPFEAPYSISKYCVIHCACPYCITIILCVFLLDLRVVLCWKCTWFILRGCQCGVCDMIAEKQANISTHESVTHGHCSVFFADACWLLICHQPLFQGYFTAFGLHIDRFHQMQQALLFSFQPLVL